LSTSSDVPKRHYYDTWPEMRDGLLAAAQPNLIWRGVSDATWCILTSLDRFATQHAIPDRTALEAKLLSLYALRSAELGLEGDHLSDQQRWALGQHWGLPTPLLDWSRSPMVAAFFAASSTNSVPEPDRTLALYSLQTDDFMGPGDASIVFPPAGPWNARLKAQQGLFTDLRVGGCLIDTLQVRGKLPKLTVYMCPGVLSSRILVELESMTVDSLTMFPDMDGVVRHVRTLAAR
jgi:hypothetical protein